MELEIRTDPQLAEIRITIQAPGPSAELSAILERLTAGERGILGFQGTKAVPLDPDHILRFYGEEKEVRAQTAAGDIYSIRQRLYELERLLSGLRFVRVSHSEIVNLHYVTALDLSFTGTIQVTLKGGITTYVSRRYVKKIKEVLGI